MKTRCLVALFLFTLVAPVFVSAGESSGLLRESVGGKVLKRANGETFPTRQIELIVPQAAGGGTDVFCRQLANAMYKVIGQPVMVNNITGASGLRGIGIAIKAAPDGYTLVASNPPGEQIAWLLQNPGFEMKDLTAIGCYSSDPMVLAVHKDVPYTTFPELVEAFKKEELTAIGTSGGEFAAQILKDRGGLGYQDIVTYPGSGAFVAALLRREVDVGVAPSNSMLTAVKDGDVRPIMVLTQERFSTMPNTPAFGADYGFDAVDSVVMLSRCIFAPPNLPDDIRQYMGEVMEEALKDPELVAWAKGRGLPVFYLDGEKTEEILNSALEISKVIDLK